MNVLDRAADQIITCATCGDTTVNEGTLHTTVDLPIGWIRATGNNRSHTFCSSTCVSAFDGWWQDAPTAVTASR